jgi:hypothetical protein
MGSIESTLSNGHFGQKEHERVQPWNWNIEMSWPHPNEGRVTSSFSGQPNCKQTSGPPYKATDCNQVRWMAGLHVVTERTNGAAAQLMFYTSVTRSNVYQRLRLGCYQSCATVHGPLPSDRNRNVYPSYRELSTQHPDMQRYSIFHAYFARSTHNYRNGTNATVSFTRAVTL